MEFWVTEGVWLELNTFGNLSGECILTPPFETLQNQSHTHTQKVTFLVICLWGLLFQNSMYVSQITLKQSKKLHETSSQNLKIYVHEY